LTARYAEDVPPPADPRPLTGEPLALDLVDTVWIDDAGRHDLLDDPALTAAWLERWDLPPAVDAPARRRLRTTREALRALLEQPIDAAARAAVDAVLDRGRVRLALAAGGPEERVEAPAAWLPSWLAARDLLRLLADRRDRVRRCANPDCVLWFADTTRSGTRRWCSMTGGCGSRLKGRRHADRLRGRAAG
jgi:predicted RNA-binding Zn ribbon-like protein